MLIDLTENPTCIECGLCREVCPVFQTQRQEEYSPRGRAMLGYAGLQTLVFYQCTLCRACRAICPVEHDPGGETLRAGLISAGIETEANQLMIANIRTYGNPFGPLAEGELPKTLTCC
ncbi:MAG: 4Fe-4S dicluster domain-containing protein [Anaerolineae bacterium]|nr:4Fe-4S dicluster domain-containing protein [Anaerolineae bacterium]